MVNIEEAKRKYPELSWDVLVRERWFAQPENTVGGWCVTLERIEGTPADGNPPIACFTTEDTAKHIARLHNDWIAYVLATRDGKRPPDVEHLEPSADRAPES